MPRRTPDTPKGNEAYHTCEVVEILQEIFGAFGAEAEVDAVTGRTWGIRLAKVAGKTCRVMSQETYENLRLLGVLEDMQEFHKRATRKAAQ